MALPGFMATGLQIGKLQKGARGRISTSPAILDSEKARPV